MLQLVGEIDGDDPIGIRRLQIEGDVEPFLASLRTTSVVDLTIEPARLEDVFLELYETSESP